MPLVVTDNIIKTDVGICGFKLFVLKLLSMFMCFQFGLSNNKYECLFV